MRKYGMVALVLLAALCPPLLGLGRYSLQLLDIALVNVILVLSVNLVFGMAGQMSLGHAGLFAAGAYASAILTVTYKQPFLVGLLAAVAAGTLSGLLIGAPALRLKGHYLAFATLGFGEIVRLVILNLPTVTRGHDGFPGIPAPLLFGWRVRTLGQQYYLLLAAVLLTIWISDNVRRSRLGRALTAVREDELAAQVAGLNVSLLKIFAFCLSAGLAGLAGSLYAHLFTFISPDVFSMDLSIGVIAMLMVGGYGTIGGSILGAIVLTLLPEWLRFSKAYYMFIYGAGIVAIMAFLPGGVVGAAGRLWTNLRPAAGQERGGR